MFKVLFFSILTGLFVRYLTLNEVQGMCDKHEQYRFGETYYTCFADQPLEQQEVKK